MGLETAPWWSTYTSNWFQNIHAVEALQILWEKVQHLSEITKEILPLWGWRLTETVSKKLINILDCITDFIYLSWWNGFNWLINISIVKFPSHNMTERNVIFLSSNEEILLNSIWINISCQVSFYIGSELKFMQEKKTS